MTMYDNRTRLSYEVWQEVNQHYPEEIFGPIPRTVRLSEAPSFGKTIFEYDPNGQGSKAYLAFAKEVQSRFFSQEGGQMRFIRKLVPFLKKRRLKAKIVAKSKAPELSAPHWLRIQNQILLTEALTHPSFNQHKRDKPDNQRLEFLGDSILGAVLSEELSIFFPKETKVFSAETGQCLHAERSWPN